MKRRSEMETAKETTIAPASGVDSRTKAVRMGYVAAGMLALGPFLPFAGSPMTGSINAMEMGLGAPFLVFAALSGLLVWRGWMWGLWATGALASGLFALLYMGYLSARADQRGSFMGGMNSVSMQWGALVLLAGSVLLLVSAYQGRKRTSD
jgi:hypothetical protein